MKTTMPVIDAAFEMVAICKKSFPVEGSPEFFALTDAVHKLECACLAYKAELLRPTDGPGDSVRLLAVAKGCHDYGGGHRDKQYEAFQHGIATVVRALEAAMKKDPNDTQVAALERMGRAAMQSQEKAPDAREGKEL